jgi:aspartyl-tRNA synthetase
MERATDPPTYETTPAYRTHRLADLDDSQLGETLRLAGFLQRLRVLGKVAFLELRDGDHVLQCVIEPPCAAFDGRGSLTLESVLSVSGVLRSRPTGKARTASVMGRYELQLSAIEVLSRADPLPFAIAGEGEPPEELRMRYRYLDLRRPRLRRNLLLRGRLLARLRELLSERGSSRSKPPS